MLDSASSSGTDDKGASGVVADSIYQDGGSGREFDNPTVGLCELVVHHLRWTFHRGPMSISTTIRDEVAALNVEAMP